MLALFVTTVVFAEELKGEGDFVFIGGITADDYSYSESCNVKDRIGENILVAGPSPHIERFISGNYFLHSINWKIADSLASDGALWGGAERRRRTIFYSHASGPQIRKIPIVWQNPIEGLDVDMILHFPRRSIASILPNWRKTPSRDLASFKVSVSNGLEVNRNESPLPGYQGAFGYLGGFFSGVGGNLCCLQSPENQIALSTAYYDQTSGKNGQQQIKQPAGIIWWRRWVTSFVFLCGSLYAVRNGLRDLLLGKRISGWGWLCGALLFGEGASFTLWLGFGVM
jgi:hypothetical protein